MKYIIGIDGGGTKTNAQVTDLNLNKLIELNGAASNFLVKGTEAVSATLFELIDGCREKLNCGFDDIAMVLLGTTGAGRRNDAAMLEEAFASYAGQKGVKINFHVESDARIALEGAFSGKPGSILIAGTGSIMFGKDASGNVQRVGGFGRYLGDEGSGYVLGKKCLIAVSKDYDGRGELTLLTSLTASKFGINSTEKLITEIYKNNFDIAQAAPLVIEAAEQGDYEALRIVDEETDELVLHIDAMLKKVHLEELDVAFIGGIISSDNIFSRELKRKVKEQLPNVNIKQPDYPPAMGAVVMAKELLNK